MIYEAFIYSILSIQSNFSQSIEERIGPREPWLNDSLSLCVNEPKFLVGHLNRRDSFCERKCLTENAGSQLLTSPINESKLVVQATDHRKTIFERTKYEIVRRTNNYLSFSVDKTPQRVNFDWSQSFAKAFRRLVELRNPPTRLVDKCALIEVFTRVLLARIRLVIRDESKTIRK